MSYSQALETQGNVRRFMVSLDGVAYLVGLLQDARYRHGISGAWTPDTIVDVMRYGPEHGEPYYWAPEICRLVADAATTLPSYGLRRPVLPSEAGYFHFATPLPLPSREVGPSDLAGIGWFWADDDSRLQMTFFTDEGLSSHPGVPIPVATGSWRADQTWHECLGMLERTGVVVSYQHRLELMFRYAAACLAFIEQPYFAVERHRPDRSARKRALIEIGHEPTVNVIQLRRAVSSGSGRDGGDNGPVEWSCQWPVRPHWRMQACGQDRVDRRPVLVRGYIKGDPSKPLKASSDRLFVVTR